MQRSMDITAQRAASAAIWVIDTRESLGMPVMLNFVGASPANSDIFICDKRKLCKGTRPT